MTMVHPLNQGTRTEREQKEEFQLISRKEKFKREFVEVQRKEREKKMAGSKMLWLRMNSAPSNLSTSEASFWSS